jgi:hypothetical protein
MWNHAVEQRVTVTRDSGVRTGKVIAATEGDVTIKYDDNGHDEVMAQDAPELSDADATPAVERPKPLP